MYQKLFGGQTLPDLESGIQSFPNSVAGFRGGTPGGVRERGRAER